MLYLSATEQIKEFNIPRKRALKSFAKTAEALKKLMTATEEAVPYIFRIACLQGDFNTPEGKSMIVTRVLEAVKPINDEIARAAHCQWLAAQMNLDSSLIISRLNGMMNMDAGNASVQARPYHQKTPTPFTMEGAANSPTQSAQGTSRTPPPFLKPEEPLTKVWGVIFDIALHGKKFAEELAFMQDVIDALPDTMLGIAVNQLLAYTAQGEWNTAIEEISSSDVFNDPVVGQAIMASDYPDVKPDDARCRQAFDDCVIKVRLGAISRQIEQLQQNMQLEGDAEKRNALFVEINKLILKKNDLKRQRSAL